MKIVLIILLSLGITSCSDKTFDLPVIELIDPLNRKSIVNIPASKEQEILNYNDALYLPTISKGTLRNESTKIVTIDEKLFLAFSVYNGNKNISNIALQSLTPEIMYFKAYRVIPVSNWYTEANKSRSDLEYIPDALFALPMTSNGAYYFNVLPQERLQLFLELKFKLTGSHNIDIRFDFINGRHSLLQSVPVTVVENNIVTTEFKSIIFNNINLQSGTSVVDTWKEVGLTHLQVNYVPTIYFNSNGEPLGTIVSRSVNSTGFRNTAYPWIKEGGSILLFWESNYGKVAPLPDGTFIKPFTPPWFKAYKFVLEEQFKLLQKMYPEITKSQIIIYLVDEFQSVENVKKSYNLSQISEFSQFLENEMPEFKTLVTYGYKSNDESVKLLTGIDIQVPHINLPSQTMLNNRFLNPTTVYKSLEGQSQKWMYSVESGKKSPLERFRFLPMISVAQGYKGFSWYAFADHSHSTWNAVDGKRLDYSLYYHKEPQNKIYKYWTDRLGTQEYLTSSLRLKSMEQGIKNAKMLAFLIQNKTHLEPQNLEKLDLIILELAKFNVESSKRVDFTEEMLQSYQEIEISLRLLQATL